MLARSEFHTINRENMSRYQSLVIVTAFITFIDFTRASYAQSPVGEQSVPALFTAEQAAIGEKIFVERCSGCHNVDLSDGGHGPGLATDNFWAQWDGQPARPLYGRIISTMPAENPGSLVQADALSIVAFILNTNNYPAGDKPLAAPGDLDGIQLRRLKK